MRPHCLYALRKTTNINDTSTSYGGLAPSHCTATYPFLESLIMLFCFQAAKTDKNLHSTDVIFEDMPDDSYSKFQIVIE